MPEEHAFKVHGFPKQFCVQESKQKVVDLLLWLFDPGLESKANFYKLFILLDHSNTFGYISSSLVSSCASSCGIGARSSYQSSTAEICNRLFFFFQIFRRLDRLNDQNFNA